MLSESGSSHFVGDGRFELTATAVTAAALRFIVPFAAGGGVDAAARLLGTQLQKQLGVTVIVENKAGGSGTIGGKAMQTAPADGHTLLFSAATHVLARQVLSAPPNDPQTDFAPVARTGSAPLMLVVAPAKPQASSPTRWPR